MIEDEQKEAERLAQKKFPDSDGFNHLGTREIWKAGYLEACEAKRAEIRGLRLKAHPAGLDNLWEKLEAERARSAKLEEQITLLRKAISSMRVGRLSRYYSRKYLKQANSIAENEASRD